MPKSDRQKTKILYIRDYLERNSDADHPVSTQELLEYLANWASSASAKAFTRIFRRCRVRGGYHDGSRREGRLLRGLPGV